MKWQGYRAILTMPETAPVLSQGKTIVVLLPDSGDRYYSTAIFVD